MAASGPRNRRGVMLLRQGRQSLLGNRVGPRGGNETRVRFPPPPCSVATYRLRDGDYRVDDDRKIQRGRALSRRRARMASCVAPDLDYQVAEAIHNRRVL